MTHYADLDALRRSVSDDVDRLNFGAQEQHTPKKAHKYGARATTVDGITFASQKEAREYQALSTLERMGMISGLTLQPRYELQPAFDRDGVHYRKIEYVADFAFVRDGRQVVVDSKGIETPVFKLKRKLFLAKYPELILEVR